MVHTETQVIMWLACSGLIGGVVFGFIIGKQADQDLFPGCAGFGGGLVFGAIVAALVGFVLGFFVIPWDVPGKPGLGQALEMCFTGIFIGLIPGAVGGIVGGTLSIFWPRKTG